MKQYSIKGNYKGFELNLGIVATLSNDLDELKEEIKAKFNVSDVILEEIKTKSNKKEVLDVLPF